MLAFVWKSMPFWVFLLAALANNFCPMLNKHYGAKQSKKKKLVHTCRFVKERGGQTDTKTDQRKRTTASGAGGLACCHHDSIKRHTMLLNTLIQRKRWGHLTFLSPPSSSQAAANVRDVPDVVLQRGHALLHGADLGVPLSHRLHQVAVGLLRLIQQSVGCQQLRNDAHTRKHAHGKGQ